MMRVRSLVLSGVALLGLVNLAVAGDKLTPEQAKKAVEAMEKAHLTLAMAISAAERDSKGQAIGGTATLDKETLWIEVPVYVHDKLMMAHVNNTGEVGETKPADTHPDAAKAENIVKAFKDAKFNWNTVIDNAEKHSKGKAVSARSTLVGTDIELWVTCLAGGDLVHCKIDKTGKVTSEEKAHKPKANP